jgi:hypothetical protein
MVHKVFGLSRAAARPNWQKRAPLSLRAAAFGERSNQWQLAFLHRLVELGGFISVPDGVVNQELVELIEADYVLDGSGGSSRTRYEITEAGRAAIKSSPDG